MVKGGFKPYPHNSQLKGKSHLKVIELDINASQACFGLGKIFERISPHVPDIGDPVVV